MESRQVIYLSILLILAVYNVGCWGMLDKSSWKDPQQSLVLGWTRVRMKDLSSSTVTESTCNETSELDIHQLDACTKVSSPCSLRVSVSCSSIHSGINIFNNSLSMCAAVGEMQDDDLREVVLYQSQNREDIEVGIIDNYKRNTIPYYFHDNNCGLKNIQFTENFDVCAFLRCIVRNNLNCTLNNEIFVSNFQCATININDEKNPPWLLEEKEENSTPPPILTAGTSDEFFHPNTIYLIGSSVILLILILAVCGSCFATLYCKERKICCFTENFGDEIVELEIKPKRMYETQGNTLDSHTYMNTAQRFSLRGEAGHYDVLGKEVLYDDIAPSTSRS